MKFEKVFIEGLLLITPDVHKDARGFFYESFNKKKFTEGGIDLNFVQDNISKSSKGTIRGLHYQSGKFAQGKLCTVVEGKVLDVALDIRHGSPTFGKYFSVELNDETKNQLWIPPGFAHGFSVLSDYAIFSYKCTSLYEPQSERTILFSDSDLNINWIVEDPVVSEKDMKGTPFKKIEKDFNY